MRVIISLCIVYLLAGCAANNGILIKRKYTKGYYLNMASHKKTHPKEIVPVEQEILSEKIEFVRVERQFVEKSVVISEMIPLAKTHMASSQTSKAAHNSKEIPDQESLVSPKEKIQTAVHNLRSGTKYDDLKFGLWVILFILFSFLYAFAIMAQSPGIPFGAALLIGMLCAALTMLTGIAWL